MIQHRVSLNNFFINKVYNLKNKKSATKPRFVLNLKKRCFCFSKQKNNETICLEKQNAGFVGTPSFLLTMLTVDFIIFIRQKIIKKNLFIYKHTIKKARGVSKKTSVFIKNTNWIFLQQQTLKQQQK